MTFCYRVASAWHLSILVLVIQHSDILAQCLVVIFGWLELDPTNSIEVWHFQRFAEINIKAVSCLLDHLSWNPNWHRLQANCKLVGIDIFIKKINSLSFFTHLLEMRVLLHRIVFFTEPLVLLMFFQKLFTVILVMTLLILFIVSLQVGNVPILHRCELLVGYQRLRQTRSVNSILGILTVSFRSKSSLCPFDLSLTVVTFVISGLIMMLSVSWPGPWPVLSPALTTIIFVDWMRFLTLRASMLLNTAIAL